MKIVDRFLPVKENNRPLYENITLQIKALILKGRLRPAEQLPPERELAEIFGVSRTCIREAIKSLAAVGFVHVEHGKGIFVAQEVDKNEDLTQIMSKLFSSNTSSMKDLFDIRKLIEPQATVWAAERCSDEEGAAIVNNVEEFIKQQAEGSANFIKVWEYDTRFHLMIAKAAKNEVLLRMMHSILDFLAESRKSTLRLDGRATKSLEEHLSIAKAIKSHNSKAAELAMQVHLHSVEADLFE